MKRQRGIALGQLLFWGFGLAIVLVLSMKAIPAVIEYYTILKNVKAVAGQVGEDTTVSQVRSAYAKYVEIDDTEAVLPNDLEVFKDGGQIVISFSYTEKVHLFGPVSLAFDFEGSATGGR